MISDNFLNIKNIDKNYFSHSVIIGLSTKQNYKFSYMSWLLNKTLHIDLTLINDNNRFKVDDLKSKHENLIQGLFFNPPQEQVFDSNKFPLFGYKHLYYGFSIYLLANYYNNFVRIFELKKFHFILFFKTDNPEHKEIIMNMIDTINTLDENILTEMIDINTLSYKGYFSL